jgi:hypothetical protein
MDLSLTLHQAHGSYITQAETTLTVEDKSRRERIQCARSLCPILYARSVL